ncbi:MAG: hypothetical protein H6573_33385 [Lewinellaceae bacterium]|nr:hypothetical protein [Lewinellaceae bacterium]
MLKPCSKQGFANLEVRAPARYARASRQTNRKLRFVKKNASFSYQKNEACHRPISIVKGKTSTFATTFAKASVLGEGYGGRRNLTNRPGKTKPQDVAPAARVK